MGDRANFGIKHSNGDVLFVYGHNAGEEMLSQFAHALYAVVGFGRSTDEAYATRIIIQSLMADAYAPDLGWGITMNCLCDNEHKVPVFDVEKQTVTLYDMGREYGFDHPIVVYGLTKFIEKYAK